MSLQFAAASFPPAAEALRAKARGFLAEHIAAGAFTPRSNSWTRVDPAFSALCGGQGFIGMTWPKAYGGQERSPLEQFVVVEEMLAAGAPVGGHWLASRQSGPQILKFGGDRAKREILPQVTAGRCCFALGMSEPDSGSDLASVRTRATRADGGWRIEGRKVWTTNAHRAQYMTVLCRTDASLQRHAGLSQLIVALPDPAVGVRPIRDIAGNHDFNEVTFDGCFVPDDMVLGEPGQGWSIVVDELALERSSPDRYMTTFPLVEQMAEALRGPDATSEAKRALGRLIAHTAALRQMSLSVAAMIDRRQSPDVQAAVVKDLGAVLEQEIPEVARAVLGGSADGELERHITGMVLEAPSFSLRGGAREILRGIIGKALATGA